MAEKYVRQTMINQQIPPSHKRGIKLWLRQNIFTGPVDTLISVIAAANFVWFLWHIFQWAILNAAWTGQGRAVCATIQQGGIQPDGWYGACWAFVNANFAQFIYGQYPHELRWRVDLVALVTVICLVPLLMPRIGGKVVSFVLCAVGVPIFGFFVLYGSVAGLRTVDTALWGGFMVTVVIAYMSVVIALPLGMLLALGRRSKMPLIQVCCVGFIEIVRGIPLITVLFMASVMFPLFLPSGMSIDKFLRALIGIALFTSAYMAEVFRGGLQAIGRDQYEGAEALGLRNWQIMAFIIIPQSIRLVIPNTISTIIGMFKDTSLIYIVSMFDLLGTVQRATAQSNWLSVQTPGSGLVFAGLVFWLCCFGMSRYARYIERYLNQDRRV